ncbi:hexosaminidase (glycosyl hydrolase family 20, catalytic domain) containing [Nesidiocoris tenuis]|uniref:beta-N-acetylhexosaminidase n=1 Tax=Nesidiocoris tenuis TaxID=355587 RepID=A0ABN7AYM8_9HEMI|nr:hexosaminidase (glycosyl hydrolase family 20, catalytic domain) containing [Nesidiocoris tenuis]
MRFLRRHLWLLVFTVTIVAGIWEISWMIKKKGSLTPAEKADDAGANADYSTEEMSTVIEDQKGFRVTVHLDFKGAPPKMAYLKKLLPKMAAAGCDSLLIEYEDMFPYTGKLVNLTAKNHYTPAQVRELIGWAHDLGMQVIPLVQTFGHLESALKLKEWSYLREVDKFPSAICPSHPDSFSLVTEMIQQVMVYHRGSKYIHIGCDEVFQINSCNRCRERSATTKEIFEDHVIRLAKWIRDRWPHLTPIIWDDMMRNWNPQELADSRLGKHVVPMVWVYTSDVFRIIQSKWWIYSRVFPKIWVAGAFKGAGQPRSDFPHIERRLANQRSWLEVIRRSQNSHKILGLALTGWSRFDHFAVLCELLPVSIPSLLINLLYVRAHTEEARPINNSLIYKEWRKSLSCNGYAIYPEKMNSTDARAALLHCDWPGADFYRSLVSFRILKSKIKEIENLVSERHGWLTRYNVLHNFTNPARVIDELMELGILSNLKDLEKLKVDIYHQLVYYTDEYTAKEWIEDRVLPLTSSLLSLNSIMDNLMARNDWPRRPLENNIPIFA